MWLLLCVNTAEASFIAMSFENILWDNSVSSTIVLNSINWIFTIYFKNYILEISEQEFHHSEV